MVGMEPIIEKKLFRNEKNQKMEIKNNFLILIAILIFVVCFYGYQYIPYINLRKVLDYDNSQMCSEEFYLDSEGKKQREYIYKCHGWTSSLE